MSIFDHNHIRIGGAVDEFGKPVDRPKHRYPYSYSGFVTWRGGKNSEANATVYSDRIHNGQKYDDICKEIWGNSAQYFDGRKPKDIEKFLRLFYDDPTIKLILVMEYCNVRNGYPLWRFDFYCKQDQS